VTFTVACRRLFIIDHVQAAFGLSEEVFIAVKSQMFMQSPHKLSDCGSVEKCH